MFKLYFEDIVVGSKDTFGSYKITKEEVIEFAQKYDPQFFHVDEEAAKDSVFGALCASGWHTCAISMRCLVDHIKETGFAGLGSPGVDNIKWLKPVFPGNTLTMTIEVLSKRESASRPNIGLIKQRYQTLNEKGEVVMSMDSNVMVAKRPTE